MQTIDEYITNHSPLESDSLKWIKRETHLRTTKPRMLCGRIESGILKILVSLVSAKRILEIGTFTGYSAVAMAEALPIDGELHTIDINDEMESFIREGFAKAGETGQKITLHIGDSDEIIPTLTGMFDMCFLDGNKRRYVEDLELIYPKIKVGGLIVADNTLWDGHVVDTDRNDAQTNGIRAFNDLVSNDSRFESVILPLRDGMTIIRKVF